MVRQLPRLCKIFYQICSRILHTHFVLQIRSLSLIRRTACAGAHFTRCNSTTNSHCRARQMAVCCQYLLLGALGSMTVPYFSSDKFCDSVARSWQPYRLALYFLSNIPCIQCPKYYDAYVWLPFLFFFFTWTRAFMYKLIHMITFTYTIHLIISLQIRSRKVLSVVCSNVCNKTQKINLLVTGS